MPEDIAAWNNIHLLVLIFYGSEIQAQPSWVPCFRDSHSVALLVSIRAVSTSRGLTHGCLLDSVPCRLLGYGFQLLTGSRLEVTLSCSLTLQLASLKQASQGDRDCWWDRSHSHTQSWKRHSITFDVFCSSE